LQRERGRQGSNSKANNEKEASDLSKRINPEGLDLKEKVIHISRVSKVVKGGKRFSFSALTVVGDGAGIVGFGLGKANEVPEAIRKAVEKSKKNLVKIPLIDGTIPYDSLGKFGASKVVLKPASPGTGVIAGGAIRAVVEAAGVKDILTKSIGSNNPHNLVRACIEGLLKIKDPSSVAAFRKKGEE
jgi:small subunit ribosomal protein S5